MAERPDHETAEDTVIPVAQEQIVVGKRTVETGRLRIDKTVVEREVVIDEPLLRDGVQVDRMSIGRELAPTEELPGVRYEGDVMIVPVLQEVPVFVKKVILVEELRITRIRREFRSPRTVTVRTEQVKVEHEDE